MKQHSIYEELNRVEPSYFNQVGVLGRFAEENEQLFRNFLAYLERENAEAAADAAELGISQPTDQELIETYMKRI